jgi:uncharacterized membrane protein (UPF0127 family)
MTVFSSQARVFNQTRNALLATEVALANTHWGRLRGLLGTASDDFRNGRALWIVPCRGVHTLGMGFPIDAIYLDAERSVVHIEMNLRPWRFAPIRMQAASVLELPPETIARTGTVIGDKIEISLERDR